MELIDGIGSKRVRYLLWGEPGRGLKGRRPEWEAPGGGEETGDGKRPGGGEETGDEKWPGVASGRGRETAGDGKRPGVEKRPGMRSGRGWQADEDGKQPGMASGRGYWERTGIVEWQTGVFPAPRRCSLESDGLEIPRERDG
jgi:hypothetical protein